MAYTFAQEKMNTAAANLVRSAERFCEWAESDQHALVEARQLILELMITIPSLEHFRHAGTSEVEFPRRDHQRWKQDHQRFSDLPFQYYRAIFDPHDIEATDEPVMGDLHDDLADIYGDLWHGLQAYRSGDSEEAISLWVDSYFFHWGRHASSALSAIDTFYCQNQESEQAADGNPH